jgi:ABC-2 type transport system ATP-binding protein
VTAPAPAGAPGATAGPDPVVRFDRVSKWFGSVVAVSDVSFSLGTGVTALLGPNGAGKSTVLRLLCGLARASQGDVRVLGLVPGRQPELYRRLGLVPQQESLPERETGRSFVRAAAALQGVAGVDAAARAALAEVELDPDDPRPLTAYSKGMRQRVKVAQALVHGPELLVLDEPLEGLDPRQRRHMIGLFRSLGDEGRTVLVSSHVLDEVERFGSRVLVIAQGRLAAEGDFHAIRELMDDRPHRVRVRTDDPRALAAALVREGAARGVVVADERTVLVDTVDVALLRASLAPAARDAGARLLEVAPLDDDLDSVFRYLVVRR